LLSTCSISPCQLRLDLGTLAERENSMWFADPHVRQVGRPQAAQRRLYRAPLRV
jgi:hypothetical protein